MRLLLTVTKVFFCTILSVGLTTCGGGGGGDGGDNPCGTVVDISENAFVNGRLGADDCTINDLFPGAMDASFADEFRVTIPTGGELAINLSSTEIDAYLIVLDTTGSCSGGCDPAIILAFDDDSAGDSAGGVGTDSFIRIGLTAGTYMILANSLAPETGNYDLETIFN